MFILIETLDEVMLGLPDNESFFTTACSVAPPCEVHFLIHQSVILLFVGHGPNWFILSSSAVGCVAITALVARMLVAFVPTVLCPVTMPA